MFIFYWLNPVIDVIDGKHRHYFYSLLFLAIFLVGCLHWMFCSVYGTIPISNLLFFSHLSLCFLNIYCDRKMNKMKKLTKGVQKKLTPAVNCIPSRFRKKYSLNTWWKTSIRFMFACVYVFFWENDKNYLFVMALNDGSSDFFFFSKLFEIS